ncbi:diaminohydroxyphosphoribosylaminopyrimidine deaminase [Allonocardiopsis opalescens]|uniref:Diaminohydroxyphosphoribosylaminopyrimidine deaminase n=1 Tax=Allonocardiopsis opalescens TaxID=1144618 RepID=A0A2T0Q0V8_9ACTN|nr:deaminase [Allonocardiopsis opalescens]PRX97313.1 diaminohydroxyphosphoribosylaminopyrimidine deaminase [Allonocardiopsis opalescens]
MAERRPGSPGADAHWLALAVALAGECPRSETAFSVGAVVVADDGTELARGYSREEEPHDHAEEVALRRVRAGDPALATATVYSTLEPCSRRASRPVTCTRLILRAGAPRVVIAWREPELFVDCHGVEELRAAGVEVVEMPEFAAAVRSVNAHLF